MRLPVAPDLNTKDGASNKNARMTNTLREGNKAVVRPGLVLNNTFPEYDTGLIGNGLIPLDGFLANDTEGDLGVVVIYGHDIRLVVGTTPDYQYVYADLTTTGSGAPVQLTSGGVTYYASAATQSPFTVPPDNTTELTVVVTVVTNNEAATPVEGVSVTLVESDEGTPLSGFSILNGPVETDADGEASFQVKCSSSGTTFVYGTLANSGGYTATAVTFASTEFYWQYQYGFIYGVDMNGNIAETFKGARASTDAFLLIGSRPSYVYIVDDVTKATQYASDLETVVNSSNLTECGALTARTYASGVIGVGTAGANDNIARYNDSLTFQSIIGDSAPNGPTSFSFAISNVAYMFNPTGFPVDGCDVIRYDITSNFDEIDQTSIPAAVAKKASSLDGTMYAFNSSLIFIPERTGTAPQGKIRVYNLSMELQTTLDNVFEDATLFYGMIANDSQLTVLCLTEEIHYALPGYTRTVTNNFQASILYAGMNTTTFTGGCSGITLKDRSF